MCGQTFAESGALLSMVPCAELARAEARILALEAEVDKHKARRDHFEDLLNDAIHRANEWTQRAMKAEAELINPTRWEVGFRNIVTRIHGARKDFDIPMIVDKVSDSFEENAALRQRIATLEAPFRAHAAGHDYSPPLRFSVGESRRIVVVPAGNLRGEE